MQDSISSNCVIITQQEWLNWVARGYLRIANERIRYFNNTQESFNILMNSCVDSVIFDDSLIIVTLKHDYSKPSCAIEKTPLSSYLAFNAIDNFYALNERGFNRLEDIAYLKGLKLNVNETISNLGLNWQRRQLAIQKHDKGNKFLSIFGYEPFSNLPEKLLEDKTEYYQNKYKPITEVPTDRAKKSSYAWLHSTYILKNLIPNKEFEALRNLVKEHKPLKHSYEKVTKIFLSEDENSLSTYHYMLAERLMYENIAREFGSENESLIVALTFKSHYQRLIDNDIKINLVNLKKDLLFLDTHYSNDIYSRTIVYFLAQELDENYVTPLYIASNLDKVKNSAIFDYSFYETLGYQDLNFVEDEKEISELFDFIEVESLKMYNIFKDILPNHDNAITSENEVRTTNKPSMSTENRISEDSTKDSITDIDNDINRIADANQKSHPTTAISVTPIDADCMVDNSSHPNNVTRLVTNAELDDNSTSTTFDEPVENKLNDNSNSAFDANTDQNDSSNLIPLVEPNSSFDLGSSPTTSPAMESGLDDKRDNVCDPTAISNADFITHTSLVNDAEPLMDTDFSQLIANNKSSNTNIPEQKSNLKLDNNSVTTYISDSVLKNDEQNDTDTTDNPKYSADEEIPSSSIEDGKATVTSGLTVQEKDFLGIAREILESDKKLRSGETFRVRFYEKIGEPDNMKQLFSKKMGIKEFYKKFLSITSVSPNLIPDHINNLSHFRKLVNSLEGSTSQQFLFS